MIPYRVPVEVVFRVYVEVDAEGVQEAGEMAKAVVARSNPRLTHETVPGKLVKWDEDPMNFKVGRKGLCGHTPFCETLSAHLQKETDRIVEARAKWRREMAR